MRKFICILGIIAGIAVVAFSLIAQQSNGYWGEDSYVSENKETYGGDAYTGIQNAVIESAEASSTTASNVKSLGFMTERGFEDISLMLHTLLAFGGFSMFLISAYKLFDLVAENKKAKEALPINENIESNLI